MAKVEQGEDAGMSTSFRLQGSWAKGGLWLLALAILLLEAYIPLVRTRIRQPPEVHLGFFPPAGVIKALSTEQYHFLSQVILLNCLFYYGTLVERKGRPNWQRMYQALYTASRLDPYNMDAYYFAQAVLSWDAGMFRQSIDLLEYGFSHRNWDWYLPFFLGFDYAFFLKDYARAGQYMAKAAALNPRAAWFATLASRYYYEGGRTALAIAYLRQLIPTARNKAIKKLLLTRAGALEKILKLEQAVAAYKRRFQRPPPDLQALVDAGVIRRIPKDPYGGTFYVDARGRVRTTSKLAFGRRSHGAHKD